MSNCNALIKRNFPGIQFLVDSIKGGNKEDSPFSVEKRSRFSCWDLCLISNIHEAKCFEFTVQTLPPPQGAPRGGGK